MSAPLEPRAKRKFASLRSWFDRLTTNGRTVGAGAPTVRAGEMERDTPFHLYVTLSEAKGLEILPLHYVQGQNDIRKSSG